MCIILVAYDAHVEYPLILAANRDEFYERPTKIAEFWPDAPDTLAGRDLLHGGTWLGITRTGRLAAVTNFRDPSAARPGALSRGHLISDYLNSSLSPSGYLNEVGPRSAEYNGFNLFVGALPQLWYYSNHGGDPAAVEPGIHGLSNHLLDTPWPKVELGKQALAALVASGTSLDTEEIFSILSDRSRAADSALPSTGVSLDYERILSSVFIESPIYGTRSSTVILIHRSGKVRFIERTFLPNTSNTSDANFEFELEKVTALK